MKNQFIRQSISSLSQIKLLKVIEEKFVTSGSGLVVYFENRIFELGEFPDEAFFWSRRLMEREGIESKTPPELIELLEKNDWNYIIWIPRWVVNSSEQVLLFRYAHELQHYRQEYEKIDLDEIVRFILERGKLGHKPTIKMEVISKEFDSDREAYETFLSIYGKEDWNQFVAKADQIEKQHFYLLEIMHAEWEKYKKNLDF